MRKSATATLHDNTRMQCYISAVVQAFAMPKAFQLMSLLVC